MSAQPIDWHTDPQSTGPDDIAKVMDSIDLRVNETNNTFMVDEDMFAAGMPEFDPDSMPADSAVIVLGKRRTGKSHLVADLLSKVGHKYHDVVVYTGTKFNKFWQRYVPEEYVHEGFQQDHIAKLLKAKEAVVAECIDKSPNGQEHGPECKCETLVLLDDVASEYHLHESKELSQLYTKGRHFKMSPWILTQYAYALSPAIRSNTDYAFIMHQTQRKSKEAIADEFLSQIDRKSAASVMSRHTPGYQVMVIDNTVQEDELSKVLSRYQAVENLPDYTLGDDEYLDAVRKRREDIGSRETMHADEMRSRLKRPMGKWPHVLKEIDQADVHLLFDD